MKNLTPIKLLALSTAITITLIGCGNNKTENTETTNKQTSEHHDNTATDNEKAETTETSKATIADGKITIQTAKGDVTIPVNPKPVATYDMTIMQNLVALGIKSEGLPEKLFLDTMKIDGAESTDIGTIFEPDLEALNTLKPQAILIGGRMSKNYDALNKIAPTLDLTLNQEDSYTSSKTLLSNLAQMFDKTEKADELLANLDKTVEETKALTTGKGNGLIIIVNGNKIAAQGAKSRFGFVHTLFDIPMADTNITDKGHGQPVSFEYLQKNNPDWLFVLDRSAAIGKAGESAEKVLDNELVHQTTAWKNKQIVYLSPDSYLAYGSYQQWMKDSQSIKSAFSQ